MMKMTWLDRVIKLGDRLADLTERGVVALEKLAGVEEKCEHVYTLIDDKPDTHCNKCMAPREP